ncbi:MAG: DUF4870 domain-containing protein [Akkermansiaceae bacterium]|nr:DUF4870 domain-containing protein [Akkermansiaceae bacterium]
MPAEAPPQMPVVSAAPPMPPAHADPFYLSDDDRTMGMLVHLLAILTGILGSLILWLVKKDQSRFVDHHGKEAVNFQLTMLLYIVVLMVFGLITMGFGMIIAVPLVMVIGICGLVFEIMACLAANRGEWHRYPMTIRFIS